MNKLFIDQLALEIILSTYQLTASFNIGDSDFPSLSNHISQLNVDVASGSVPPSLSPLPL